MQVLTNKECHAIGVQNGKESMVRNETETIVRYHFIHSFGDYIKSFV